MLSVFCSASIYWLIQYQYHLKTYILRTHPKPMQLASQGQSAVMCDSKTCWSPRTFCFVSDPACGLCQSRTLESFAYFLRPKPSVIPCRILSLIWHVQNIIPARVKAAEHPLAPRRATMFKWHFPPRNARLVQQTQAHTRLYTIPQ